ncbi:unnamed protein product [Trichobilharzia regenti]|nr:unnamed protein product [Trichobilharzia regenti]
MNPLFFNINFIIETQLESQIGLGSLPFSNMNKSGAGVCRFFILNQCPLNNLCPLRHIKADRTVVCKHWLRGLCKKGDDCEFLHEYDMTKMPECYFFSKFGECMNKECPFLHIDPATKMQDCPWYDRGFCRNGPLCRNRHVRRVACKNYINGFCLKGRECKYAHALGAGTVQSGATAGSRFTSERLKFGGAMGTQAPGSGPRQGPHKPLYEVTCFKCGEKGHYANRCSKGYLAFLSKVSLQPHETESAQVQ